MNGDLTTCSKTDAVLARHLDGDLGDFFDDGFAFACGDTLQAHVGECATCRTALRRARRLDAALASASGSSLCDHTAHAGSSWRELEARWFGAAAPTPRPTSTPVATPSRAPATAHSLGVAAAAFAAVATAWLVRAPDAADERPPVAAASARTDDVPVAEPLPPMLLAADAVRRWPRPAADADLAAQAVPAVPELARRLADAATGTDARRAAAKALFHAARSSPQTARTTIVALAALGDHDTATFRLHEEVLDAACVNTHVTGAIDAWLARIAATTAPLGRDDLAAVIVAARIGSLGLDAQLRRTTQRQPAAADVIATALRCDVRTDGGAALLLDLWHDLAALGRDDADERACAWFAGQPATTFTALVRELRTSRDGARRLRCLLALGESEHAASLTALLGHVRSPHHEEAHAAAFALSRLPLALLDHTTPSAAADEAYLLRAALARAGMPAARPWLHALALRPHELARVRACSLAEFPEVASWFREPDRAAD